MPVNGKSRRSYRGAPVSNTLGVTLSAAATNITLAVAMSGWSTDAEPFFVVVDPGTAKEEKICVKYSSSTTLTVVDPAATSTWGASASGRGADNTVDRQHEQGAVIYPVFTATEANQANELVSKYANAGSVVYQGSGTPGTFTELAVGTAAQVLKVNAGATAPEWGQVATAGIADSAVTLAKLATALQAYLVPVGTISAYAGVTAPTGWLLCDGTSTTGYTALAALVGATTPDMRGRFPIGDNSTLTLLGTGGSTTIAEGNLPSHTHTVSGTSDGMNQNSTPSHTVTDPGHNHTQNSHNHTQDAHSHTIDNHTHTNQVTYISPAASHAHNNISDYVAAGTNGASTSPTVASISTTSLSANSNTATNQATTATNQANTTGITVAAHNIAHTHTFSATTNGGTGSGTAYYQPYLVVNYIIKHD
jgi:microcystin-dependent protein